MPLRNLVAASLLVLTAIFLLGGNSPLAERITSMTAGTGSTSSSTTLTLTTTTIALGQMCGDPIPDRVIRATDALFALNAAVGLEECDLCVCDVDGTGSVSATDASILLQVAVGQAIGLSCPDC